MANRRKTRVYHATPPNFGFEDYPCWMCPDTFKLVAEVDTNDLTEAFLLTNDMGSDWWLHEQVQVFVMPCRSTSVGDVLVLPDGEAFIALRFGFHSLGHVADLAAECHT